MRWKDRVYGEASIDDRGILAVVGCPTFRRLLGIRQAGPSAFAFPFKTVTRYEHSVGVYLLLGRLGAGEKERVAGLLHDISHTAFSHAVDFVMTSEEQDHHEALKPEFLERSDMREALAGLGYEPRDFFDDSLYRLLERPLPWLCADRLDYFLRDGLTCGVISEKAASLILEDLRVVEGTIAFASEGIAREASGLFGMMNRDWWASETESYIYNEFADVLREGFRLGALRKKDLYENDEYVLDRLRGARSALIEEKLGRIMDFRVERTKGYAPRVIPKTRWIDPPVVVGDSYRRLSELKGG